MAHDPEDLHYPGGVTAPGYKYAFNMWIILSLTIITAGLIVFIITKLDLFST